MREGAMGPQPLSPWKSGGFGGFDFQGGFQSLTADKLPPPLLRTKKRTKN